MRGGSSQVARVRGDVLAPSHLLLPDSFLLIGSAFDFLEDKRTNMKAMSVGAKASGLPPSHLLA